MADGRIMDTGVNATRIRDARSDRGDLDRCMVCNLESVSEIVSFLFAFAHSCCTLCASAPCKLRHNSVTFRPWHRSIGASLQGAVPVADAHF